MSFALPISPPFYKIYRQQEIFQISVPKIMLISFILSSEKNEFLGNAKNNFALIGAIVSLR